MRTLIFHTGNPKTGSSALQVWLAQNRDELLRHSIDYLPIGDYTAGRHGHVTAGNAGPLAHAVGQPNVRARIADPQRPIAQLFRAIEDSRSEIGIVSSELFAFADLDAFGSLVATLRERGILSRSVYFIRPQDQQLGSAYLQQVRRHGYISTPDAFARTNYRRLRHLQYDQRHRALEALFGADNATVFLYDEAKRSPHGVVGALASHLGIDPSSVAQSVGEVNSSLSPHDVAILMQLNQYKPRARFADLVLANLVRARGRAARIAMGEADPGSGSAARPRLSLLSREVRQEIADHFGAGNRTLGQRVFGREDILPIDTSDEASQPISPEILTVRDVFDALGGMLVEFDLRLHQVELRLAQAGIAEVAVKKRGPATAGHQRGPGAPGVEDDDDTPNDDED